MKSIFGLLMVCFTWSGFSQVSIQTSYSENVVKNWRNVSFLQFSGKQAETLYNFLEREEVEEGNFSEINSFQFSSWI